MADPNRIIHPERFWKHVEPFAALSACWTWTGGLDRYGYGRFKYGNDGKQWTFVAHRVAFHLLRGPIPDGLVIDHLCRNRSCVNPDHMEPVTNRENIRRGLTGRRTGRANSASLCVNGHPWTEENARIDRRGYRVCLACNRERLRRFHERHPGKVAEYRRRHP